MPEPAGAVHIFEEPTPYFGTLKESVESLRTSQDLGALENYLGRNQEEKPGGFQV